MLHHRKLPESGEIIAAKYQLLRQLGAGGMGVVFEAVNRSTDKHVALKFLSPELSATADAQARFEREAKATGRIHHPNVVAVHDYGEHEGRLYMVLELLKGQPLREWLDDGTVTLEAACRVMFPVMRGVAAAHAVGVLHRDLKPDNVFMAEMPDGMDAMPKVLDFGLAKLCAPQDKATQLSVMGIAMGTYEFMAPEQLRARGEEDARTDVYALGAMLFSMVAGRLPYTADNPVDLALRMLESEPPLLDTLVAVPHGAAEVVARALAFQPTGRFATVEEFAAALEPFAGGMTFRGSKYRPGSVAAPAPDSMGLTEQISVRPLATPFRASSTPVRRGPRWPWVLSGLFIAMALVMGGWLLLDMRGVSHQAHAPESVVGAARAERGAPPPALRPPDVRPPESGTVKPQVALPAAAVEEEGLTLIEAVSAEADGEPQGWPDARPEWPDARPEARPATPRPGREPEERDARRSLRKRRASGKGESTSSLIEDQQRNPATSEPGASGAGGPSSPPVTVPSSDPPARTKPPRSGMSMATDEF